VLRRQLQPGEVLYREGEYGATAYLLEKGSLIVSIRSSLVHVHNDQPTGWVSRFLGHSVLHNLSRAEAGAAGRRRSIRTDANLSLSPDNPVAVLTPRDQLIGEMACLSNYPRAATVEAAEPSQVLELRRNVVLALLRQPTARAILNQTYREGALT